MSVFVEATVFLLFAVPCFPKSGKMDSCFLLGTLWMPQGLGRKEWFCMDAITAEIIIAAFILGGIAYTVLSSRASRKKLLAEFEEEFGAVPEEDVEFESVSIPWKTGTEREGEYFVDDTTWNDLDMDRLFARLDSCQTSLGEEYLYVLLHRFSDDGEAERREELADCLDRNPELRLKLQLLLHRVGKSNYNGLSAFLANSEEYALPHTWVYRVAAVLPFVCLCAVPFYHAFAVVLAVLLFCTNILINYFVGHRLEHTSPAVRYFSSALWCGGALCSVWKEGSCTVRSDLQRAIAELRGLRGSVSGSMRNSVITSDLESSAEFARILTLHEIRSYNRMISRISAHRESCQKLCRCIAELDAAVAVLSFRKSLPYWSRPHYIRQMQINVQDLYHPLLQDAVPNSAVLTKAAVITGSNASGKSTFLKAMAINGIFAMAIGTCTARVYQAPRALVISSMAVRDDITAGESYFVSEVKSLKRILDHAHRMPCLCFVDEILKGTNTAERIAASAAVLQHLYREECFCLVATHDIELTQILGSNFENYHFSEKISDEHISFDYQIKPGPSKTTNAIRLLSYMKFDPEIICRAEKLAVDLQR